MILRVLPTVVLLLNTSVAPAGDPVSLEWKFERGDVFYLAEHVKNKSTTVVMGMRTPEDREDYHLARFTVLQRGREGVVLEKEILSWTSSENGVEDQKLNTIFKGAKFTVTLAPDGSIRRFEGYEAVMKKIEQADPLEAPLMRKLLTEGLFKAPLQMTFNVLPEKAVRQGDKWQREVTIPFGPVGTFQFKTDFTYEGKAADGDKIGANSSVTFQVAKADDAFPFRVAKLEIKSGSPKGSILFNRETGRLVRYELASPMVLAMTVESMGQTIDMLIEGDETRTIQLSNENPLDKKK